MFKILKDNLGIDPQILNIDFESGMISAIEKIFPSATIAGCFFHFAQNMWKHFAANGLAVYYAPDSEINLLFNMVLALSHVPLEHITAGFEVIWQRAEKLKLPPPPKRIQQTNAYVLVAKSNSKSKNPNQPHEISATQATVDQDERDLKLAKMQTFLKYVEQYYIGVKRQTSSGQRVVPMFEHEWWSVHSRVISDREKVSCRQES